MQLMTYLVQKSILIVAVIAIHLRRYQFIDIELIIQTRYSSGVVTSAVLNGKRYGHLIV